MGNSYDKHPSTTARTPVRKSIKAIIPRHPLEWQEKYHGLTAAAQPKEWTDQVPHKYCGALDMGRIGKPNKAHRCEACLAIKARQSKLRDGPNDIKAGRDEKSHLKFQLHDESVPDVPGLNCWEKQVESVMEGKMERRQELESPPEMPEETRPDLTKQTTRRRR